MLNSTHSSYGTSEEAGNRLWLVKREYCTLEVPRAGTIKTPICLGPAVLGLTTGLTMPGWGLAFP